MKVSRVGLNHDLARVSWPLIRLEHDQERLVFRSRWMSFLFPLEVLDDTGRALVIESTEIVAVSRTGVLLGWGMHMETKTVSFWCWGPRVVSAVEELQPVPAIAVGRRRFGSATHRQSGRSRPP